MNGQVSQRILVGLFLVSGWGVGKAAEAKHANALGNLAKKYIQEGVNMAGARTSMEKHFFQATTHSNTVDVMGQASALGWNTLFIECEPFMEGKKRQERFTCRGFVVGAGGKKATTLPSLVGLTYVWQMGEDGNMVGMNQSAFKDLKDSTGRPLPMMEMYTVYCAFIDFFAMSNSVVRENPRGTGGDLSALKKVGDQTVGFSSHEKVGAPLEGNASQMDFVMGDTSLRLDGFGVARNRVCALVKFDAGYSKVENHSKADPTTNIDVLGTSLFRGLVWFDPASKWVEQAEWEELLYCDARMGGGLQRMLIHRTAWIHALSSTELDQRLQEHLK